MKQKELRDKILSLAPKETGEFVNLVDDNVNQDGGDGVEGNEDDYEEEGVISQASKAVLLHVVIRTVPQSNDYHANLMP